jgi:glycyl-tRNA synthetase beta chain
MNAVAKPARAATRDFLVEIGTEELPPKSLPALSQAFTDGLVAGLAAAGVKHGAVQPYAAPRRLAVLVKKVAERQPDQEIRRKGPPVQAAFDASGAPTRAATAFAESCGTTVAALGRVQEAKGEFLFHAGTKAGAETATLLAGIVQASLDRLPIAKRMRWGSGTAEFVRPVHWVVMLFGADVIPATILGVAAGNATRGHRFMAPKDLKLASPASYAKTLESRGKVVADFAARRERIREGVHALAREHGVEAIVSDALLDEVTALVEWPVPVAGRFEQRFLDLPPEVLIATLQDHQRYFPTEEPAAGGVSAADSAAPRSGRLSSLFVTVANLESRDPAQVRAGNERVVRPRLSDAAFFWDTDRKATLASRRAALADVTFQAQLGSYADKAARVAALARRIAPLAGADEARVARAAELAKCDLLTGLVGEFPELQGTMGAYYARHDGEADDVAAAMAEQYLPRYAGDALPATATGTVLALADKLDTIVGIFAIGQKPTGTKDPFALRRAALGVLRIALEKRLDLDLPATIDAALAAVRADVARLAQAKAAGAKPDAAKPDAPKSGAAAAPASAGGADTVAADVYDYVTERLRALYVESGDGITTEMFDAVLDRRPASPLDFDARLRALAAFLQLPDAQALAAANKRIANILRKAAEQKLAVDPGTLQAGLLQQGEERALHDALVRVRPDAERLLDARDYAGAMRRLAELRPAVDAFFDGVMVMADDPAVRANRLALLATLRGLFLRTADLSRLPG